MKIALTTAEAALVTHAEIPDYLTGPPAVVGWGDRVFQLHAPATSPETAAIYREVFAVALVPDNIRPLTEDQA